VILKRLVLENYCLFAGRCEFDLTPRVRGGIVRPVVLFGGKNGAGKTSILSAIQLAFYGRRSVGDRLSEREYRLALRNRIHRNAETEMRASFAKVGLEFEMVTQGEKHVYYIERGWTGIGDGEVEETFTAQKDGLPLDDVSSEHWQSFVANIVPERLSQLFFFDGEKIQTIAEDVSSQAAISEAIQTLLGLDMVKSLQADLSIYRSKLLKTGNPEAYEREISGVETAIARLVSEKARLKTEQDSLIAELRKTRERITILESQLEAGGANFARASGSNQARKELLRGRRASLEEAIRLECDGAVAFTLCPSVGRKLVKQLRVEEARKRAHVAEREACAFGERLLSAARREMRDSALRTVEAFLDRQIGAYRKAQADKPAEPELHGVSERDSAVVVATVERDARASAERLHGLLSELERVVEELSRVEVDLEKTPEQLELQSPFELLKEQNQLLGRQEERRRQCEERFHEVETAMAASEREKRDVESRMETARDVTQKIAYIEKLQPALESYMERLTRAKISALQSEVTECYNRLARKADFVRRIEIAPADFSVSVIDRMGRSIPKEDLSSGEKQIFAIAMLWGLARTSGRPLPVVIDTPLGRLDSDHRMNLVKNYFPHAGHQVILLSTDTEVDMPLFRELNGSVSHCYHLRYDEQQNRTSAEEEYFWRECVPA